MLPAVARLDEITGCGIIAAQAVIAEIGLDMTVFGTSGRMVSWAKRCPQTRQSGKKTTTARPALISPPPCISAPDNPLCPTRSAAPEPPRSAPRTSATPAPSPRITPNPSPVARPKYPFRASLGVSSFP